MLIPSDQLEAFEAVARTLNFTRAASELHITQSALSQRVKKLEQSLGITLFVRATSGARLTDDAELLLRYCRTRRGLEEEMLGELRAGKAPGLVGHLRLASYSTLLRSVLIPAVAPLLREHASLRCDFLSRETHELPSLLQRGEADFIVVDRFVERENLERVQLGQESYVMIESSRHAGRADVYFDNDPDDHMTEQFFLMQDKKPPQIRRAFGGEAYAILDAVAQGLGRAVMPQHVLGDADVRAIRGHKPFTVPVVLHYFHQPYYSASHQALVKALTQNSRKHL